ncbi:MFS transporter [Methylobacterium sp. WL64]|uniref:MFS transporter n=1 Tax=Methylobacterium sp. WL64 TaxID=2603894 RepID=UPI0011C7C43F|nr:MFS transporter [Methylobacterium sp. WL64]TXM97142.1 MFS transporter [Methylobacterium sp. WL64]
MSHTVTTTAELTPAVVPRSGTANVVRLAIAQALAGANSTVVFATGAVVGDRLAPNEVLATLPISVFVVGMAACTLPSGSIARRHGRRAVFMTGTSCGVLVGLLSAWAILAASFWLFCAAMFLGGAYAAVVFSFRFAAADCVLAARRPRALSAVMAGGVFGGVIGPQLVTYTMDLWPSHTFAATFLAQAAVAALSALVLSGVRLPRPAAEEMAGMRPMGVILCQPSFIIAVICGAVSYLLMNFVMTAAPLAMRLCGHAQEDANLGLQWHVIAMYGPSFLTGRLITHFGAQGVVAVGLVLMGVAGVIGLAGVDVVYFWLSLVALGVGWNFGFVGASALILECQRPEDWTRVQPVNDFIVFGMVAVGSFSSGGLLTSYGWDTVLWVLFAPLVLAASALTFSAASRRSRRLT